MKAKTSIGERKTYGQWLKALWTPEKPFAVNYCRKKDRIKKMTKKEFSKFYKK